MKICFLNDIMILGGGELWVLGAARHLADAGHEVSVVAPHGAALQEECQRRGMDVYVYSRGIDGFPFCEGLYRFLRERRVDVLYCTLMGNYREVEVLGGIAQRINAERATDRMIVILKTGLPPLETFSPADYGAGAGPEVRRLHVVSERVRAAFVRSMPAMGRGFVEVVHEGTESSRVAMPAGGRDAARQAWKLAHDEVLVTCLARLVDGMKGQGVLLRCVPTLLRRFPQARFVLAGDGQDRELLEELAEDSGVAHAVRFPGHVDDVATLLAATDVLCHPSLNDGLPNAIVEAMTMGVPVVASHIGGIPELVRHDETGLLTMPNDMRSLSDALATLLADPKRRRTMGRRARASITGHFDLRRNTARLAARLEEELGMFARAPGRRTAPRAPTGDGPIPILFLFNVLRTGGEETELGILTAHLDRRRYIPSVLTLWRADEHTPVLEALRHWHVPVDDACHLIHDDEDKIRHIREKIRREHIGIVVAMQDTGLAYRVFQGLPPGTCSLIEHGGIVQDAARIPKDHTARYVGVSPAIAAAAQQLMPDPAHALCIPSMVDTDVYDAAEWSPARAAIRQWLHEEVLHLNGHGDDTRIVLFVGRLDRKKRAEQFIAAARSIVPVVRDVVFCIVGGHDVYHPEYEVALKEDGRDLVDAKRLFFLGPRGDVAGILTTSTMLVLPSMGEGMSHVISEAGAAGLAVVATDDGAAREQLDDGRCGTLVPVDDQRALTAAILDLLNDPVRAAQLGCRLRAWVGERYSAKVLMPVWHTLLGEVSDELASTGQKAERKSARSRVGGRALRVETEPVLPFPTSIQIQTNTACNASCIMCPHPTVSREVSMGRMEESLYREILAQCADEPSLRRIEPFLMNEPFTDPRLVDWIAMAKERVPQATVTVTTNGSLVTPKVSDRLVTSGLDAIWFSFNGATRETYEHIMGISYDTVRQNIDYLISICPPSLRILVNMIETAPMREEIDRNIREWRHRGVEAGSSPLVNRGGNVENFVQLNYKPLSERPIRVCELPFYRVYILYTGDLVLCCMDWRRQVLLGNVGTTPIRDLWHGPQLQEIRQRMLNREVEGMPLCSTCSYTLK